MYRYIYIRTYVYEFLCTYMHISIYIHIHKCLAQICTCASGVFFRKALKQRPFQEIDCNIIMRRRAHEDEGVGRVCVCVCVYVCVCM